MVSIVLLRNESIKFIWKKLTEYVYLSYNKSRVRCPQKLTLTLDKSVILKAKKYAKSHNRSLSNIVEEYLKSLTYQEKREDEMEISPVVKALWGSVKEWPGSKDHKEIMTDELIRKYLR